MRPLIGTELKRFLRDYKRRNAPEREVAVLLQSVAYPVNVGSVFRMADGAGLSALVLSGITPRPPHPKIDKIGRRKDSRVPWRYEENPVEAVHQMQAEGYHVVAVEISDTAVPYHHYDYPEKVCLVVGNEDHGVTKAVLAECDGAVFLPMYGKGLSLNVHVALSVAVYHVLHA